jgi:hypothetical protein
LRRTWDLKSKRGHEWRFQARFRGYFKSLQNSFHRLIKAVLLIGLHFSGFHIADPNKGNEELLVFGKGDFKSDVEGIPIYPTSKETGYILVSNQQNDTFNVYLREDPAKGKIAKIPVSTSESNGSEVAHVNLGAKFPKGVFVAMSNGRVFHLYDWRIVEDSIKAALSKQN